MENQNKNMPNSPIDKVKIDLIKQMIENAERSIQTAREVLGQVDPQHKSKQEFSSREGAGKIVEGFFNGEAMIGSDGKIYPVPANYASKSKLVDGDRLKLTINSDGSFVYKQIGPAERIRMRGNLISKDADTYYVVANNDYYRVLKASVTYFKARAGDELTIIIPKGKKAGWAAIENVIIPPAVADLDISSINYLIEDHANDTENIDNLSDEDDEDLETGSGEESDEDNDVLNNVLGGDAVTGENTEIKNKSIIDEWMPDLEQLKKEAFSDEKKDKDEDAF